MEAALAKNTVQVTNESLEATAGTEMVGPYYVLQEVGSQRHFCRGFAVHEELWQENGGKKMGEQYILALIFLPTFGLPVRTADEAYLVYAQSVRFVIE